MDDNVKILRSLTGADTWAARCALAASDGNMSVAETLLRQPPNTIELLVKFNQLEARIEELEIELKRLRRKE